MSKRKLDYAKILTSTILMSVLPVTVFAYPLTVTNLTPSTLSVKVNGQCSGEFGNIGAMISHTAETKQLEVLCKSSSANCLAQVYLAPSCASEEIANFYFNTKTRTNGKGSASPHYKISVDAHRVTVSRV